MTAGGDPLAAVGIDCAMAGFGGATGTADGLNADFANADTSQQPFLTMPQHS
jgi:hypothetical protein